MNEREEGTTYLRSWIFKSAEVPVVRDHFQIYVHLFGATTRAGLRAARFLIGGSVLASLAAVAVLLGREVQGRRGRAAMTLWVISFGVAIAADNVQWIAPVSFSAFGLLLPALVAQFGCEQGAETVPGG